MILGERRLCQKDSLYTKLKLWKSRKEEKGRKETEGVRGGELYAPGHSERTALTC
jgi:hypothetical protein